jgi:hypothetical protein
MKKKKLGIKKITLRDLDDNTLNNMAGGTGTTSDWQCETSMCSQANQNCGTGDTQCGSCNNTCGCPSDAIPSTCLPATTPMQPSWVDPNCGTC